MASVPVLNITDNVMDIYGDPDSLRELHRQAEYMNAPPYNTPPKKLADALACVLNGKVSVVPEDPTVHEVEGSKSTRYLVDKDGCSCPANTKSQKSRWVCYHAVAVELYTRWQRELGAPSSQAQLFAVPKTIDERLAATPQDRPQPTIPPQDDMQTVPTPEPTIEAPRASEEPRMATVPANDVYQAPTFPLEAPLTRRPIAAIIADLSRPLPASCVATLPASNNRPAQKYLHWWAVAMILDTYAPGWSGEVVRVEKIGDKCAVTYRITIPAAEGPCIREDAGMEDEDKDSYGDAMTNAIATAFKRTAAKFGVGRDLYAVKDDTAKALAAHLQQEQQASLHALRQQVEARGIEPRLVEGWLEQQIPLGTIHRALHRLQSTSPA